MKKTKPLSPIAAGILDGLNEALAHSKGTATETTRSTTIYVPNCREIRKNLNLSQLEFSKAYRIPLATLQGWEQGRRLPDSTASAYLRSIAKYPNEIRCVQEEVYN